LQAFTKLQQTKLREQWRDRHARELTLVYALEIKGYSRAAARVMADNILRGEPVMSGHNRSLYRE